MNTQVTKNYFADGGDTLVIGGKLVVEEGAEVSGLEGGGGSYTLPAASASAIGGVKLAAAQADSTATELSGLVSDFNALLGKLKSAGIMASDA